VFSVLSLVVERSVCLSYGLCAAACQLLLTIDREGAFGLFNRQQENAVDLHNVGRVPVTLATTVRENILIISKT
jgi:hypothetical protein